MSGVYFFKFLKVIFLLLSFEILYHSLFCLSILFLIFFSSLVNTLKVRLCAVGVTHSALEVLRSVIK